jgi:hypothetical protein
LESVRPQDFETGTLFPAGVPAIFTDQVNIELLQEVGFEVGDAFTGGDWRLLKLENGE